MVFVPGWTKTKLWMKIFVFIQLGTSMASEDEKSLRLRLAMGEDDEAWSSFSQRRRSKLEFLQEKYRQHREMGKNVGRQRHPLGGFRLTQARQFFCPQISCLQGNGKIHPHSLFYSLSFTSPKSYKKVSNRSLN